jgi:hypothetical protein
MGTWDAPQMLRRYRGAGGHARRYMYVEVGIPDKIGEISNRTQTYQMIVSRSYVDTLRVACRRRCAVR